MWGPGPPAQRQLGCGGWGAWVKGNVGHGGARGPLGRNLVGGGARGRGAAGEGGGRGRGSEGGGESREEEDQGVGGEGVGRNWTGVTGEGGVSVALDIAARGAPKK